MCGIVGIAGQGSANVVPLVLERLKHLEYRGYDSAGIATLQKGKLKRCRAQGKLTQLEARLAKTPISGALAIGHTRWATHGAPSERNAHPHNNGKVSVVHNGIIENFQSLKDRLAKKGLAFASQTDSEVIAALFADALKTHKGNYQKAAKACFSTLQGAFALAILLEGEQLLLAARRGSPLVLGMSEDKNFIGSDALALAGLADKLLYLEDDEWAVVTPKQCAVYNLAGKKITRAAVPAPHSALLADKGEHRHFMRKEIFEQSEVLTHTLAQYIEPTKPALRLQLPKIKLDKVKRISLVACGTAYYAAHIARYWLEEFTDIPADIDIASEYRYRTHKHDKSHLAVFISQSGETADTLAALKHCKAQGAQCLAIVNVESSSIAKAADYVLPIFAGAEIGVASTKAFVCQLAVLLLLALHLGQAGKTLSATKAKQILQLLLTLPRHISEVLRLDDSIMQLAQGFLAEQPHALYLGRGVGFPLAREGALKLKELSYIHAEAFAAGELKHGPIALVDKEMPIIVLAPETAGKNILRDKTLSNMAETHARGGKILLIGNKAVCAQAKGHYAEKLLMPDLDPLLVPMVYTIPLQLLAYHTACAKGTDVDQPRNLAKSVTVE